MGIQHSVPPGSGNTTVAGTRVWEYTYRRHDDVEHRAVVEVGQQLSALPWRRARAEALLPRDGHEPLLHGHKSITINQSEPILHGHKSITINQSEPLLHGTNQSQSITVNQSISNKYTLTLGKG